MKTKSTTPLTPEQLAAKANAEAFFADLLKPTPKAAKPTKAATQAKVWRETATKSILTKPGWVAQLRIFTVTHQHCTSCNSDHTYTGVQQVRYSAVNRRDGLAIETTAVIPTPLATPSEVRHVYEDSEYCATCIHMMEDLESAINDASRPTQLSLFN